MPLACAKDCSDRNRLTVAASEALRDVSYGIRLREEGCIIKVDFEFFRVPEAPCTEYAVKLRIDRRDVLWGDAVRDATDKFTVRIARFQHKNADAIKLDDAALKEREQETVDKTIAMQSTISAAIFIFFMFITPCVAYL